VRLATPERGEAELGQLDLQVAQVVGAQRQVVSKVCRCGQERFALERGLPGSKTRCTVAPDMAGSGAAEARVSVVPNRMALC
jgi:hypothetical protein